MPIFQYKCDKCSSVFEHLVSSGTDGNASCVSCGSKKVKRLYSSSFGIHLKKRECCGRYCEEGEKCPVSSGGGFAVGDGCGCPFKKFSV